MNERKGFIVATLHLTAHIGVGTVMFCAIAAAAGGLEKVVHWLKAQGVSDTVTTVLGYVEHLIFFIDITCFLVLLFGAAIQFIREVIREVREQ